MKGKKKKESEAFEIFTELLKRRVPALGILGGFHLLPVSPHLPRVSETSATAGVTKYGTRFGEVICVCV